MKNIVILICAACLFHYAAFGQNQRVVDSLNAVLEMKTGGDRYSPLYELAFEYLDKDNEKALVFIEQAEQAALLSGDSLWIVKSKRVRGQILYKLERRDECIALFESALAISDRNDFVKESMMISNTFGLLCLFADRYDKALEFFDRSMEIAEQEKNSPYMAYSLNNIGVLYYRLSDFGKALRYFLEAARFREYANQDPFLNVGLCYIYLEQYQNARKYLEKSIDQCLKNCSDNRVIMHQKFARGMMFYGLKEYRDAKKEFLASLEIARKIKDSRMLLDNIYQMSTMLMREGKYKVAEVYLKEGESIINRGVPLPDQIIGIFGGFSQLYFDLKRYKEAAVYQSKYIELRDSIYNRDLTSRLMTAESEFRQRENKAKIASQHEIIMLKEQIIARQKVLSTIIGLLGFLILAFAIFVCYSFIQKRNVNRLLQQRVRERTTELEAARDGLLRALREKDLRINRASRFMLDSANTIEGLCLTARKEVSDPLIQSYLHRIIKTKVGMVRNISAVLNADVLVRPT